MQPVDYLQSKRSLDGRNFQLKVLDECNKGIGSNMYVEAFMEGNVPRQIENKLKTPHPEIKGKMELHDVDIIICYDGSPIVAIHCRSNMDEIQKPLIAVNRMREYNPTSSIFHVVATLDNGRKNGPGHLSKEGCNKHGRSYSKDYDAIYSWRDDVMETPGHMPDGTYTTQIVRSHKRLCEDIIFTLIHNKGLIDFNHIRNGLINKVVSTVTRPTLEELPDFRMLFPDGEFE